MSDYKSLIITVPDFPKKGIKFKDITPLLKDPKAVSQCLDAMMPDPETQIDLVVGIESRGFILGPLLAQRLSCGFVPIRKKGKLPGQTVSAQYTLEYGVAEIEMHLDAIKPGDRVLLHDDVLATGGTAAAAIQLIEALGGVVIACSFIIELQALNGQARLGDYPVKASCFF
jgi:adenine phosphoribosyltransferase